MARRTFDVIDVCEIFTHWHAGRSKNEVAGSLGLARNTVRKYVAAAEAAGMVPGGPPVSQERWAELAREWFPELADTRLRQVTWPAIEVHRDYIVAQLAAGVTMATIYQRLRDERGLAASVASLRRYVAANLPEEARRSQVTVLRLVPAEPGQEAQIDYGQLGRWTDPRSGRRHTVQAFAMVLCCSRMLFVRPVIAMDQRAWTECHVAAMEFFGGVPARLVPDNLKTGVDRPGLYDPKINRSYAELAAHYGCLVDPARSRKPRDKPRVAYCTSSGRCAVFWCRPAQTVLVGSDILLAALGVSGCGEASLAELASLCADWGVGAWRGVEALAFVVVGVSGAETGVVPDLDGAGGHVELCGDLGQGEHAGVEQPLAAAG
jgi:transposase